MEKEQIEKVENLMKDENYVKHLFSLGSAEEISKELEKEDIDISPDDLRKIYSLAKKKASGELTDAELEEVAGGFIPWVPIVAWTIHLSSSAGVTYGILHCAGVL